MYKFIQDLTKINKFPKDLKQEEEEIYNMALETHKYLSKVKFTPIGTLIFNECVSLLFKK